MVKCPVCPVVALPGACVVCAYVTGASNIRSIPMLKEKFFILRGNYRFKVA
jgi:hypothetical protein